MKTSTPLSIIFGLICYLNLNGQKAIEANPENWTAQNCKAIFDGEVIQVKHTDGNGTAILWLNNTNFKNGTVELDIKGNDVVSFLGLAFHGLDGDKYDAIYFRPFNFKSEEKRGNAIQYIDAPDNQWHVLRKKFPGKYENEVLGVPDPNDWFRAKYVINFPEVRVYVNGSAKPTLVVEQISKRKDGKLGLWVDSDDGRFRNLKITKSN